MPTAISQDGTSIAYTAIGSGNPLILVGGAFSQRTFPGLVQLAQLLEDDFTVVNYDRRGRGDSGNIGPYAVEREIEDLDAVINAVGGTAHVWGLSSGAALALRAADCLKITKLALYEPPYDGGDPHRRAQEAANLEALVIAGRMDQATQYFLRNVGAPSLIVTLMRFMPFWKRLRALAHTLPYELAIIGDHCVPTTLASRVRVPTLVLSGEKSDIRLRDGAKTLAQTIPHAQHRVLRGQTHNVSMTALAPELRAFFVA